MLEPSSTRDYEWNETIRARLLFHSFNTLLEPLSPSNSDYKFVEKNINSSIFLVSNSCHYSIHSIFRLHRPDDELRFQRCLDRKLPRMYLWHGSPNYLWFSILAQGLQPTGVGTFRVVAQDDGSNQNSGLFFGDFIAKSIPYSERSRSASNIITLAWCEVALGPENLREERHNDPYALGRVHSTNLVPDPDQIIHPPDDPGLTIPMGPKAGYTSDRGYGAFNEYILYRPDQVIIRYLVRLRCS